MLLKILAFAFIVLGALIAFAAGPIVKKYNLHKDVKITFEHIMDEDEISDFKYSKAVVNMKAIGMLIMLPGLILIIFAFR